MGNETLVKVGVKSNLPKFFQNETYMVFMVLHVPWENEDVIDVTEHEIVQIFMKNIVHQMLENIMYVNKAKWHHNIFKMAITSFEHRFPFITFLNAHQFVCSMSINFGVHLGMTKLVQQP
jgi:hypothetical protein